MPYKGIESFDIEEKCIRTWAEDLSPSTVKNYVYYFLGYLDWIRSKGYWKSAQEMLDDYSKLEGNDQFKHIDTLKEYIKSKGTGSSDKRITWFIVRNFYDYHRLPLPKISRTETSRLFRPTEADKERALKLAPLQLDEVRQLILDLPQPYKAAVMVMFQGAMGLAELIQFNQSSWEMVVKDLDNQEPMRVDLYRSKTSREGVKKYFTFLGEDAKNLIKQWLKIRPNTKRSELFLTFNKNTKEWVPIRPPQIGSAITKSAKRAGLIKEDELKRYHVHAHELRDLFKSLCTLNGVNQIASEFFLGHVIDKLGYDKSPEYDREWFRNEYRKVEPILNVISNPKGTDKEKDLKQAFKKELLLVAGYTEEEAESLNLAQLSDEEIRDKIREKLLGVTENNGVKQKVIPIDEVEDYITQGWEYVAPILDDRAIVKVPY
jgi:site-specific recombinase XerC